jgi:hypothetical protein
VEPPKVSVIEFGVVTEAGLLALEKYAAQIGASAGIEFLSNKHAPVGFISFDLDFYSSTTAAFELFTAEDNAVLPRVMRWTPRAPSHDIS